MKSTALGAQEFRCPTGGPGYSIQKQDNPAEHASGAHNQARHGITQLMLREFLDYLRISRGEIFTEVVRGVKWGVSLIYSVCVNAFVMPSLKILFLIKHSSLFLLFEKHHHM